MWQRITQIVFFRNYFLTTSRNLLTDLGQPPLRTVKKVLSAAQFCRLAQRHPSMNLHPTGD